MKLRKLSLVIPFLLLSPYSHSNTDTLFEIYETYKINKQANPFLIKLNRRHFRAGIKWGISGTCGDFDMDLSIENNIKSADLKAMWNNWVTQAKAAFDPASLLALAFQRANPDLYEIMQNGMIEAKGMFEEDMDLCNNIQNTILDSAPSGAIDKLSVGSEFTNVVTNAYKNNSKTDVGDLVDFVSGAGERGFELMGVKYGGKDQPDAPIVELAATAGFNTAREKQSSAAIIDVNNTSSISTSDYDELPFAKMFKNPGELSDFITDIVGSIEVATRDDSTSVQRSKGRGAQVYIYELKDEILDEWKKVEDTYDWGNAPLNKIKLDDFNEAQQGAFLTGTMVEDLMNMSNGDRTIYVDSLARESALVYTINKIVTAKKLLIMGRNESSLHDAQPIKELLDEQVAALQHEIDEIEQDERIRKNYSSNTAEQLLKRALRNSQKGVDVNSTQRSHK